MGVIKTLDEYNVFEPQRIDTKTISETVRDTNLKQMNKDVLGFTQELVYKAILSHPDGICDKHIQKWIKEQYNTYLPISSICGRRNDLKKQGLVVGVGKDYFPDHNGITRLNTLWGVLHQ